MTINHIQHIKNINIIECGFYYGYSYHTPHLVIDLQICFIVINDRLHLLGLRLLQDTLHDLYNNNQASIWEQNQWHKPSQNLKIKINTLKDNIQLYIDFLDNYFKDNDHANCNINKNKKLIFNLPLAVYSATSLQLQVWQYLLNLPYGSIKSYKNIADELNSKAYRAIGTIVGQNPIPIIIPCHRIVASNSKCLNLNQDQDQEIINKNNLRDQDYGKYRYGIETKRKLILIEHALL